MDGVYTTALPDRRHWHLDKTLNVSHLLTTAVIAGSLFAYANNMDRRVAILEEKMQVQSQENKRASNEVRELAADVKHELRLLRTELLRLVASNQGGKE